MAGRKTFTAGEVLQAADVNDFLMDQSVMVFAGTAARGSAIPSPSEGMVTYREDDDVVEVYNGSSFVPVGPGQILQVVSTTKTDTFSASVGAGATVAVTGMSATITPSSTNSKILVLTDLSIATDSNENSISHILKRDGTPIGVGDVASNRTRITGASGTGKNYLQNTSGSNVLDSPSTTSAVTYSVDIHNTRGAGVTLYANRTALDTDSSDYTRSGSTITLMEVAG